MREKVHNEQSQTGSFFDAVMKASMNIPTGKLAPTIFQLYVLWAHTL